MHIPPFPTSRMQERCDATKILSGLACMQSSELITPSSILYGILIRMNINNAAIMLEMMLPEGRDKQFATNFRGNARR